MMEEVRMKGDLAATDQGKYCGMAVLSICEALTLAINDQSKNLSRPSFCSTEDMVCMSVASFGQAFTGDL